MKKHGLFTESENKDPVHKAASGAFEMKFSILFTKVNNANTDVTFNSKVRRFGLETK